MSATTNHFKGGITTSPIVDAAAAVALYTEWASGAYDPAAFGGGQVGGSNAWAAATLALKRA